MHLSKKYLRGINSILRFRHFSRFSENKTSIKWRNHRLCSVQGQKEKKNNRIKTRYEWIVYRMTSCRNGYCFRTKWSVLSFWKKKRFSQISFCWISAFSVYFFYAFVAVNWISHLGRHQRMSWTSGHFTSFNKQNKHINSFLLRLKYYNTSTDSTLYICLFIYFFHKSTSDASDIYNPLSFLYKLQSDWFAQ